jgi:hypothetical protein
MQTKDQPLALTWKQFAHEMPRRYHGDGSGTIWRGDAEIGVRIVAECRVSCCHEPALPGSPVGWCDRHEYDRLHR